MHLRSLAGDRRSGLWLRELCESVGVLCAGAATIAQLLATSSGSIKATATTGCNAIPECDFAVRSADGRRVFVVANIDASGQAYQRLERTAVEAGQQFGAVRTFTPLQNVPGLGLDADWFPDHTKLMTTDGVRLLSVPVDWAE
jgi:hypothetical protein